MQANAQALQKEKNGYRLLVDGKPFVMLSGELHNSTSSSLEYMAPVWQKLKAMHLNSVIASISWEQFEPQEGVFDYSIIDGIIRQAEENEMKVAIIWFASWKNGDSSYAPLWVKQDTKRFFRAKNPEGNPIRIVSPLCEAAKKADAKAFAALMKRIKEQDKKQTIILMQAENEVGIFYDFDYCEASQKQFRQLVPPTLLSYLKANESHLSSEIKSCWIENGRKTKGTWTDVFGDNAKAKEFFMTWQYATYIQEVVAQGKAQYDIPVYVNAWLEQYRDGQPDYPRGGPIAKVMDIYKAAAPAIDWVSPDIYLPTFREICAEYHRTDNPLFIPESTREGGRAFYALAEHDALCFAPFGIEDGYNDPEFIAAYSVLNELLPTIIQYRGSGKMHAFFKQAKEDHAVIEFDNYKIIAYYEGENAPNYGLIIQTDDDEFIISGIGARLHFFSKNNKLRADIATVWEGKYENNAWKTTRWLNGDETGAHNFVRLWGREGSVKMPGVYRIKLYTF
jgi:beta-galactosidase GanA